MTESTTISRRRFVAAGAGAAVIAGAGYLGFEGLSRADAADSTAPPAETYTRHSLCNACENQCGFTAYVVNGVLTKLVGDSGSPYGGGKLCGRGYGYATIAYNKDRLTEPLKRNENGSFSPISWDEAYFEIAEKLTALIAAHGAKTLALVHSPRPSGAFYGPRFFNALGSPNVYTHAAACNLSRDSGFAQVFGEGNYSADIANAKLVMLIGYNPAESVSPATLAAMQKSRANGGHIVLVDPRMTKSSTFADEWLPINPGTDLALVLAMAHVLVQRGIYHREFVAAHTVGFEDWAKRLAQYSPAWAEPITGIPAVTISRLAEQFAEAAPASVIDAGGYGAYGSAYLNSGETARAIALFNTLLGNWNQKGGALILPSPSFGKLDSNKFPEVPKPAGTKLGSSEYPLALNSLGSSVFAAEKAKEGALKAMFFYHSNVAADCPNPAYLAEALSQLELSVVIDVQMSETAQLAHYV
ncbi:MAG: molybdopterin-dependent oxidoreductase, partial [Coriobacteriales bacterium]|nr:molybdopterin-dependent oxidoreductase [Coriobacteriales bacterium]